MNFELINRAKQGDERAMEEVLQSNTGLVHSIVRKFSGRGYETEDLYQTGCIGLIKAIRNFDTSYDVQFSTYAVPMIMGEIRRFIRDDGIIKVSRSLKQISAKAYVFKEQQEKETGREPTVGEIAAALGISTEELVMALDSSQPVRSINVAIDDEEHSLGDVLESGENIEEEVVERISISSAIRLLKPRERQIIVLRYFSGKTQSQVAALLGISQVQVSRIEKRVLNEMKNQMIC